MARQKIDIPVPGQLQDIESADSTFDTNTDSGTAPLRDYGLYLSGDEFALDDSERSAWNSS